MKFFINKQTSLRDSEDSPFLNYSDLILIVVNRRKEGGYTLQEQRLKLRILDKIDEAKHGDTIEFEDTEYQDFLNDLGSMKWGFIHKDIVEFSDYCLNLK